jgi:hypothetical protein
VCYAGHNPAFGMVNCAVQEQSCHVAENEMWASATFSQYSAVLIIVM